MTFLSRLIGGNKESVELRRAPIMMGGRPRSPKWHTFSKHFLERKVCMACGRSEYLNAHHIKPYHLFPELELVESNLIPLCEGVSACHYLCGHRGTSWSVNTFNPAEAASRYKSLLAWLKAAA